MDADEVFNFVIENVLTIQEAADYLGITRMGLWKATRNGALRQTPNGLYIKADLDEY
ncbi:MAG: helix-turn-helix domain-containing protein [Synergistes sp.]|nr:helix-turn-helix domain-containing protein [Synergistes sp.]